jgi:hypothetical protein
MDAILLGLATLMLVVTPGIRPAKPSGSEAAGPSGSQGAVRDDQRRVATPHAAFEAGADYIVVGRPIRDAADPRMLRKARIGRAANLFALCGDDGVNAEVAVRAAQLVPPRSGTPLTCVLHIFDAQLCNLVHERELARGRGVFRFKYFQWVAVLFTEMFLDALTDQPAALRRKLNEFFKADYMRGALPTVVAGKLALKRAGPPKLVIRD